MALFASNMDRAVKPWLFQNNLQADSAALIKKLNKSYTIYGDMLLLPPTAFQGPEWTSFNPTPNDDHLQELYKFICKELKVTHIALNKPIPLHNSSSSSASPPTGQDTNAFNILRSPTNFHPLHGRFGPSTCHLPPRTEDFENAYWVTAKQNGIFQIWAPRWTMFSRGNVSEKARLLTLPSVEKAVEEGGEMGCSVVDLYAGIGYFAFSYAKAGVKKVLCWDLNEWSCEGLRRGAIRNKWEVGMYDDEKEDGMEEFVERKAGARFLVFNETNERAPERIDAVRMKLPPIRHVNCGMLPSSRKSLGLAVRVLDPEMGGYMHVHENFLVEEIEAKAQRTRREVEALVRAHGRDFGVEIEYINRLKSYAPGVMHCVIDIAVLPAPTTGEES